MMSNNMSDQIICSVLVAGESIVCDGIIYDLPEGTLSTSDMMFWVYLGIYCALVITAGKYGSFVLSKSKCLQMIHDVIDTNAKYM